MTSGRRYATGLTAIVCSCWDRYYDRSEKQNDPCHGTPRWVYLNSVVGHRASTKSISGTMRIFYLPEADTSQPPHEFSEQPVPQPRPANGLRRCRTLWNVDIA